MPRLAFRTPLLLSLLLCSWLAACGGKPEAGQGELPKADTIDAQALAADEVEAILQSAARALPDEMAISVVDRRGVVLGSATTFGFDRDDFMAECVTPFACPLFDTPESSDCAVVERSLQLARTAAFFSADQTPLTSRSVRFLSGEHFPPSIRNAGAAALFGIENTNRGCSFDAATDPIAAEVPRARSMAAELNPSLRCDSADDSAEARCGCTRGIATFPGGVPIYKDGGKGGRMVGGIGVALRAAVLEPDAVAAGDAPNAILRREDTDPTLVLGEVAARAFAGDNAGFPILRSLGFPGVCAGPDAPECCTETDPNKKMCTFFGILPAANLPFDPVIFVDGIEIPEVAMSPSVPGVGTGQPTSDYIIAPNAAAAPVPSRWLVPFRAPASDPAGGVVDLITDCADCPLAPDPSCGPDDARLCPQDVCAIIDAGCREARRIRGAIRLPLEARTAMVLAISDRAGELVGLFRMDDATVFSIDVAVAKSRNVNYFSSAAIDPIDAQDCPGPMTCVGPAFEPPLAITNRTLSFAAQPFFPSGIEGSAPGPFRRVFVEDSAMPCTNGREPANGRQNGIVFFPGSVPLYKNNQLVGGFGVSGDGVEQDDIVSLAGAIAATGFTPSAPLRRADEQFVRGVRLPYLKFNRRPEQ